MGICSVCRGARVVTVWKRCPTCNGSGNVNGHYCTNYGCRGGLVTQTETCRPCNGTGKTN